MLDQIKQILNEIRPDLDLDKEKALIDDGILDSFDIVTLVGELNEAFDIEITVENLLPENFNNIQGIERLVQELSE